MRTLRMSLAGTVILALLGGGTALAQSEDTAPTEPTGVVINRADETLVEQGSSTQRSGDAFSTIEGVVMSWTWDASDPRLSGTATYTFNSHGYSGPLNALLDAIVVTVVNDGGSWAGTGQGIGSMEYGAMQMLMLTGEGGYEGLTAFLTEDIKNEMGTIRGVIVAGGLPPYPEPPAE